MFKTETMNRLAVYSYLTRYRDGNGKGVTESLSGKETVRLTWPQGLTWLVTWLATFFLNKARNGWLSETSGFAGTCLIHSAIVR